MRQLHWLWVGMLYFSCTSHPPLDTVDDVSLQRYEGIWYEIASFPKQFQKGCTCTNAEYTLKEDYVKVVNRCYKKEKEKWTRIEGKAFVDDPETNSKLNVQFFWPFRGKYWIIELADDYSWAAVGHPNRESLWILSREKQMPEAQYDTILASVEEKGFDISHLERTSQDCDTYK